MLLCLLYCLPSAQASLFDCRYFRCATAFAAQRSTDFVSRAYATATYLPCIVDEVSTEMSGSGDEKFSSQPLNLHMPYGYDMFFHDVIARVCCFARRCRVPEGVMRYVATPDVATAIPYPDCRAPILCPVPPEAVADCSRHHRCETGREEAH